jgi:hypothetical protein
MPNGGVARLYGSSVFFLRTSILFSIMAVLIYIPSSVQGSLFSKSPPVLV